jgi:tripartite-type tricarboxylate transporter receptor subunit TctC
VKKIIVLSVLLISSVAFAWQPTKPIDTTISFPTGSGNDLIFRPLAAIVEKNTGVTFVIKNKPGAGGTVGNQEFVGLPNDGHFINVGSVGGFAGMDFTYPNFIKNPPYTIDSFSYAIHLGYSPGAIIAKAEDPVSTPKDFINVLTSDPNLTIAHSGAANRLMLESVMLKVNAREKNPKLILVEHKGPAQSVLDVAGGHVRFAVLPLSVAGAHHNAGKIKVVAITSKQKVISLPDVQTMSSAIKDFDVVIPWGLILPKNTSIEVLNWYSEKFKQALSEPGIRENFAKSYIFVKDDLLTPKAFKEYVYEQYKENKGVVEIINKSN